MVAPGVRRSAAAAAQEAEEAEREQRASAAALADYAAFRQRLLADLEAATAARERLRQEQRQYEELAANIDVLQRVGGLVWMAGGRPGWGTAGTGAVAVDERSDRMSVAPVVTASCVA